MSEFLPAGFQQPKRPVKVEGIDTGAPLTPQELQLQQRLFSSVATLPQAFKSWVPEHMALNALLWTRSQVQGLDRLNGQFSEIGTTYDDTETADVNVSNGVNSEPVISVPAGTYFCIYVFQGQITDGTGYMTAQLYDVSGSAAFGSIAKVEAPSVPGPVTTALCIGSVTVTGDSNDIKITYAKLGAGNRHAAQRFLIALRTN